MRYEDLKTLDELREKGSITEEEFQREKAKILAEDNDRSLSQYINLILKDHLKENNNN